MRLLIDIPDNEYQFIKDLQSLIIGGRGNCRTIQRDVINAIKNGTPYEDRPKGKWIEERDKRGHLITRKCPICKAFHDGMIINFCPNCGADMRGDV